jgi:hypothetical protein
MNTLAAKPAVLGTILVLLAGVGNSQVSSSGVGSPPTAISTSDGTWMSAALVGSLDAKKNKPGDLIEAKTTQDLKQDGKTIIPKGTTLTGHLTQAQPRAKDQPQSTLGILFDRAGMQYGTPLQARIVLEAVAIPQRLPNAFGNEDNAVKADGIDRGFGGSGALDSATSGRALPVDAKKKPQLPGNFGGLDDKGALMPGSQGVFGIDETAIDYEASSYTGVVLVSTTRNVHLDARTQMVLRFLGQTR